MVRILPAPWVEWYSTPLRVRYDIINMFWTWNRTYFWKGYTFKSHILWYDLYKKNIKEPSGTLKYDKKHVGQKFFCRISERKKPLNLVMGIILSRRLRLWRSHVGSSNNSISSDLSFCKNTEDFRWNAIIRSIPLAFLWHFYHTFIYIVI